MGSKKTWKMHKYVGEDASQMVALGRAKVPVKDGKSQSVGTEICYFYELLNKTMFV